MSLSKLFIYLGGLISKQKEEVKGKGIKIKDNDDCSTCVFFGEDYCNLSDVPTAESDYCLNHMRL